MSLNVTLSPLFGFVGNPILLIIESSDLTTFEIRADHRKLYEGNGIGNFTVNIAEILESVIGKTVMPKGNIQDIVIPTNQWSNWVEFSIGGSSAIGEEFSCDYTAWLGGLSKMDLRYYSSVGKNIFSEKFRNSKGNFFFTTRSNSWWFSLRERELLPLLFIMPDKLSIEDSFGHRIDVNAVRGSLYGLNFEAVRHKFFTDFGSIPSYFDIITDDLACRIGIENSQLSQEAYLLRFLNSFGAYELIELTGSATIATEYPEEDNTQYNAYDSLTDDYVLSRSRATCTTKINISTGIKRPEEIRHLLDALSSDDVTLLGYGPNEIKVIPSAKDISYKAMSTEPKSIELSLKLVETDCNVGLDNNGDWNEPSPPSPQDTYTITATVNPSDVSKGYIKSGSYRSDANGVLRLVVAVGSNATIEFVSNSGYEVDHVNVDTVLEGKITSYTFTDVQASHTMYAWYMEESIAPDVAVDYLERSDKAGVYYSSLHSAMKAIKNDYPDKLSQDVTIKCIKNCIEYRSQSDPDKIISERIWTAILANWNKGSVYSLIIDGNSQYTISAYSLGGVFIKNVDNIIFKNMSFIDYSNFAKGSTPEEVAAIYSTGKIDDANKNIAVVNCRFNGSFTSALGVTGYAWYAVDTKLSSNVIIDNCTFISGGARVIKCTDIDILEITRSNVHGKLISAVSHSNLIYCSGAKKLILEDCVFDGESMNEYAMQLVNIDNILIKRSRFTNVDGQPFEIKGSKPLTLKFEGCLFDSCLKHPRYVYCRFVASIGQHVNVLSVKNNTFYMDGDANFQQVFNVSAGVENLENVNNIYVDKINKLNAIFFVDGVIGSYVSESNVYKAILYSNGQRFESLNILNNAMIPFEKRALPYYQTAGYEKNSTALNSSIKILEVENGSAGYALLGNLKEIYLSAVNHILEFDIRYMKASSKSTIGAYNLHGISWDETTDTSEGYSGVSLFDNSIFTQVAQVTLPSDEKAIMTVNCNDRTKFIRTQIYSESLSILKYGKNILFSLECNVNSEGDYIEDINYSAKIDKI